LINKIHQTRNNFGNKKVLDKVAMLLVLTVFTKELFSINIIGPSFDLFGYSYFFIYFILKIHTFKFNRSLVLFFIFWIISSLLFIFSFGYDFFPFLKQIVPILIFFLSAYDILIKRAFMINEIFEFYVKISYYTAIFGIAQWLLSLIGILILIKEPGLLDSIAYEPSHYAALIMPAAIFRFFSFKQKKIQTVVLIVSLLLTFSLTSYFVFIFAILLTKIKLSSIPILIIVFTSLYFVFPLFPERITDRFESSIEYFNGKSYTDYDTHKSLVSFGSNLDVAMNSIATNPLTGVGIGGHETNYYKYFQNKAFRFNRSFGLNFNSAHSLTIRILSEAGLIGFVFFIFFLYKSYIKKNNLNLQSNYFHLISLSCISHFLCKSIKLGGYIDYGTPFFFTLLIVVCATYKKNILS
jgi:O-antigen ligase